jgi:7-cyano-7-deazaguanine synthase
MTDTTADIAVVLASGGLDSTTVLWMLLHRGYKVLPLEFNYGQRHEVEAWYLGATLSRASSAFPGKVMPPFRVQISGLDLPGVSLLDPSAVLPTEKTDGIPSTFVPGRNSIFLSVACGLAEAIGAGTVAAGFNAVDYSGYPDCRPEYVEAMTVAINLGLRREIHVLTPVIKMTKAQVIRTGLGLEVDYGLTWSCYAGGRVPCGACDSCRIRAAGFSQVGVPDPLLERVR